MTLGDAQDIIDLIGGSVRNKNMSATTLQAWMTKLVPLDVVLAAQAANAGTQQWEYFPSWSEFFELYQVERRKRAREIGQQENAEVLKRGDKAPDWVYVWLWCRNARAPRQLRPFPQQKEWVSGESMLSEAEYKKLHKEWEKAGCPTVFNRDVSLASPPQGDG